MILDNIALRGFRNYRFLEMSPAPGLNLVLGDNARGKTNLLEAVFFLGSLRSFRGVKTVSMVGFGETDCAVSGIVSDRPVCSDPPPLAGGVRGGVDAEQDESLSQPANSENQPTPDPFHKGRGSGERHTLKVVVTKEGRRVTLDGKRPASAAEYLTTLRVASFSPEDLFLAKEYPSFRRRFIDRSIFHLFPGYMETASSCRSAAKQLNAALKAGDAKVLTAWEETIAPLAAEVTLKRRERIEALAPMAAHLYEKIFGGEGLQFVYKSAVKGADRYEVESAWRALFEKKRVESIRRGYSVAGPHTDDLSIGICGRDLKCSASRGQSKLAMLALVLADAESYHQLRGSWPVLLLDDALSELDPRRRDSLVEYISGMGQVLLTSADPVTPSGMRAARVYMVEAGDGGAVVRG